MSISPFVHPIDLSSIAKDLSSITMASNTHSSTAINGFADESVPLHTFFIPHTFLSLLLLIPKVADQPVHFQIRTLPHLTTTTNTSPISSRCCPCTRTCYHLGSRLLSSCRRSSNISCKPIGVSDSSRRHCHRGLRCRLLQQQQQQQQQNHWEQLQ